MASILKVDTLTGVTTAGSISVTGEGNSTTTNLQQGLAKASINFTQVSTQTIRSSVNISSLTDAGTGQTSGISFISSMANSLFAGSFYTNATTGEARNNFSNDYAGGFGDKSTSSFGTYSYSTVNADGAMNDVIIFGDLA